MLSRTTLIFKAMENGVSGHAVLWTDDGRCRVQVRAKGLPAKAALYAYRRMEKPELLSETAMDVRNIRRMDGLMVIGGEPLRPLLLGLVKPGDEAMLDLQSQAQSLCKIPRVETPPPKPAVRPVLAPIPKEVFLTALDPTPYVTAADGKPEPLLPPPRPSGPPADRLRPLKWPRGFEVLKPYWEQSIPRALFDQPGWRYVPAADGLWIGIRRADGQVKGIAYACKGNSPPPTAGKWQPMKSKDGTWYQLLIQSF